MPSFVATRLTHLKSPVASIGPIRRCEARALPVVTNLADLRRGSPLLQSRTTEHDWQLGGATPSEKREACDFHRREANAKTDYYGAAGKGTSSNQVERKNFNTAGAEQLIDDPRSGTRTTVKLVGRATYYSAS